MDFDLRSDSVFPLIPCPEVGCGAAMGSKEELTRHLTRDCPIAKKRRILAQQSRERELQKARELIEELERRRRPASPLSLPPQGPMVLKRAASSSSAGVPTPGVPGDSVCTQCGLPIVGCSTQRHLAERCNRRIISCPNKFLGCLAEVPLNETSKHLRENCLFEEKKNEMAIRSRAKEEFVPCPACSELVQVRFINRHDNKECSNRKVSCRNAYLGCERKIRVREREMHEEIDKMMNIPRCCLYFRGGGSNLGYEEVTKHCNGGAHIFLGENDIVAPWTVQYWVYRPHRGEVLKANIRNILVLRRAVKDRIEYETKLFRRIDYLNRKIKQLQVEAAEATANKDPVRAMQLADDLSRYALLLANLLNLYDESILLTSGWMHTLDLYFKSAFIAVESIDRTSAVEHSIHTSFCGTVDDTKPEEILTCPDCGFSQVISMGEFCQSCFKPIKPDILPDPVAIVDNQELEKQNAHATTSKDDQETANDIDSELATQAEANSQFKVVESGRRSESSGNDDEKGSNGDKEYEEEREPGRFVEGVGFVTGAIIPKESSGTEEEKVCATQSDQKGIVLDEGDSLMTNDQVPEADGTGVKLEQTQAQDQGRRDEREKNVADESEHKLSDVETATKSSQVASLDLGTSADANDSPPSALDEKMDIQTNDSSGECTKQVDGVKNSLVIDERPAPISWVEADTMGYKTWDGWIDVLLSLRGEYDACSDYLRRSREASGLLAPEGQDSKASTVTENGKGKRKSAAEIKKEKKEKKQQEKKEKAKARKEAKRLSMLFAADEEEANEMNNDGESKDVETSESPPKKEKKIPKKLIYRIAEIKQCATAIDTIAISETAAHQTPFWSMEPTAYDLSDVTNNTTEELDMPEIQDFSKIPTRFCMTIPQDLGGGTNTNTTAKSLGGVKEEDSKGISPNFGFIGDGTEVPTTLRADFMDHMNKYEERIGVACSSGLHVFQSPLAVLPYNEWTNITLVCSGPQRKPVSQNPPSRRSSKHGSRPSSRPGTEERRITRILQGGPEASPPQSRPNTSDKETVNTTLNDMNGTEETSENDQPNIDSSNFITLYVNGNAAGELQGVSCDLPMKSICASEFSYHGCLLDVRYWARARSKQEIMHDMNRLLKLPEDTGRPLRGLVGWWTCEDGTGAKLTSDVSEQRFRAKLRGFTYSKREDENTIIAKKMELLAEAQARNDRALNSGAPSAEKVR